MNLPTFLLMWVVIPEMITSQSLFNCVVLSNCSHTITESEDMQSQFGHLISHEYGPPAVSRKTIPVISDAMRLVNVFLVLSIDNM